LKNNSLKLFDSLKGKNCVLTGATGGIGKEIAYQLAEKNCNLFLIGRNEKKLKLLQTKLKTINKKIKVIYEQTDLTNLTNVDSTVKKIKNEFSPVLILINCAGKFVIKSIAQSNMSELNESFDINFKIPFILSKEFSADMVKKKWGRIIFLGSSSSYLGFAGGAIYSSSKHAILGLSRSLQSELKSKNIRVQCFSPGSTKTEMAKISTDQDFSTFLNPKEVAHFIVYSMCFDKEMTIDEVRMNRMIMR
jgi:3-oxoacyl-[acyl-carrier protein] reductase